MLGQKVNRKYLFCCPGNPLLFVRYDSAGWRDLEWCLHQQIHQSSSPETGHYCGKRYCVNGYVRIFLISLSVTHQACIFNITLTCHQNPILCSVCVFPSFLFPSLNSSRTSPQDGASASETVWEQPDWATIQYSWAAGQRAAGLLQRGVRLVWSIFHNLYL